MSKPSKRDLRILRDLRDRDAIEDAPRALPRLLSMVDAGLLRSFVAENGQLGFALTDLGKDAAQ